MQARYQIITKFLLVIYNFQYFLNFVSIYTFQMDINEHSKAIEMATGDNLSPEKIDLEHTKQNVATTADNGMNEILADKLPSTMVYKPRSASTRTPRPASTRKPKPASTRTPKPASTRTPKPASTKTPKPASIRTFKNSKQLREHDKVSSSSVRRNNSPGPVRKQWMAIKNSVLTFASKDKSVDSGKKVTRSSSSPAAVGFHNEAKKQNLGRLKLQPIGPYDDVSDLKMPKYTREAPPTSIRKSISNKVMNVIQKLNPVKLKSFFTKSKSVEVEEEVQAEIPKHQYSRASFPKWREQELMLGLKRNPKEELGKILACEDKWLKKTQNKGDQDRLRLFEDRYLSKKWACLHGTFQGFQNTCYYSSSGKMIERAYRYSPVELGGEMRSFDEVVYPYSYPNYMKYIKDNGYDMDERPSRIMPFVIRKKTDNCDRMISIRKKCLCDFHSCID